MSVLASWLVELWRDPPPSCDVILALATRPLRCWLVVRVLLRPVGLCCPSPAGRPAPPAGVWLLADVTHFLPGDSRYPATKAVNSNRDLSCRVALVPVGMRVTVGVDLTRGCSGREPGHAPEKLKIQTICSIKLFFLMNWRPSQNRPSQTVPSVVLGVVPTTSAGLPVHTQCQETAPVNTFRTAVQMHSLIS